jgi:hypothetical protein
VDKTGSRGQRPKAARSTHTSLTELEWTLSSSSQKPAVTSFAETAALFAVLEGDDVEARRIVGDMYPNERAEFAEQLDRLRSMLTDRFGNDIAATSGPRVQVLDSEGRFLSRRIGGAA